MKNLFYQLIFLLVPIIGFTQSENFIKVSGYSQFEIEPESIRLTVSITESQRDEYNKIRERSIDDILKETDLALKSIGYSNNDLIEVWPKNTNYGYRVKVHTYYLYVKDLNEAIKIRKLDVKGFKATEYKYKFPDKFEIDNLTLSEKALDDAKKRADFLAKKVNKKTGKIINITDASNNEYRPRNYNNLSKIVIEYNITVTYELLD